MTKEIPLTGKRGKGKFTVVDDFDFEWLNQFTWIVNSTGYVMRYAGNRQYKLMHREILGLESKSVHGDHINHDTLDNRRSNLRRANLQQSHQNVRSLADSASKFKGIHFDKKTGRWRAEIGAYGKRIRLGRFYSELEAAQAYNDAAIKYHGEFACLNDLSLPMSGRVVSPKPVTKSGFIGVHPKGRCWLAYVHIDYKMIRLGRFDSAEQAAHYRDNYIKEHGLSLKLNFPD